MSPKAIFKIMVDVLMTVVLLFLMGYQFWGDVAMNGWELVCSCCLLFITFSMGIGIKP